MTTTPPQKWVISPKSGPIGPLLPSTGDLNVLDHALSQVEQGADFIPAHIEQVLSPLSIAELEVAFIQGCNLVSLIMAQKGFILLMIKRKVKHGQFQQRLTNLGVDYTYANKCMNVARAMAHHPALAKIPDTRIIKQITYLPADTQAEIAQALAHAPERGSLEASEWKKHHWRELRPWVLAQIGYAFKQKNHKRREAPPLVEPPEPEWKEFIEYWDTVYHTVHAMQDWLAKHTPLPAHFYDQIATHTLAGKMSEHCGNLVLLMYPQEESEKRTPVVRAKGFASR